MGQIIDLSKKRRMRFEKTRTDRELETITFDEFGMPVDMAITGSQSLEIQDRLSPGASDLLRKLQPGLARQLGLFQALRLEKLHDNDEEIDQETQATDPIL